jgi:hypothetical protein
VKASDRFGAFLDKCLEAQVAVDVRYGNALESRRHEQNVTWLRLC